MMILRRASEPSLQLSEDRLRIDWSAAEPRIFRNDETDQKPLAMKRHGVFYVWAHETLTVWTGRQEADVFPQGIWNDGPGVYLPFQGWWQDRWFDGPLLHFTEAGPTDIVLAGRPGQLIREGDAEEPLEDWGAWLRRESFASCKDSLITAYRQRYALRDSYGLATPAWDLRALLHLTLHRLAFPQSRIFLHAEKDKVTPPWRRLCQNLNIEIPRYFTEDDAIRPLPLASDAFLQTFLIALQKQAPYVPGRLAQDLDISLKN
jgi:hypothetical protein